MEVDRFECVFPDSLQLIVFVVSHLIMSLLIILLKGDLLLIMLSRCSRQSDLFLFEYDRHLVVLSVVGSFL